MMGGGRGGDHARGRQDSGMRTGSRWRKSPTASHCDGGMDGLRARGTNRISGCGGRGAKDRELDNNLRAAWAWGSASLSRAPLTRTSASTLVLRVFIDSPVTR